MGLDPRFDEVDDAVGDGFCLPRPRPRDDKKRAFDTEHSFFLFFIQLIEIRHHADYTMCLFLDSVLEFH